MTLTRTLKIALRALRRNVMRAVLTTLGIMIGVGAVIAMTNIGEGSSAMIRRTIASMGANNFLIFPGTAASGGVSFGAGSSLTLTPTDCDAIIRECPEQSGLRTHYSQRVTDDSRIRVSVVAAVACPLNARIAASNVG